MDGAEPRPDTRAQWRANAPAWIELSRAGYDVYRDRFNTPTFLAKLPPVDGLSCLDLGCGEGTNTRLLADRGAEVVALDISGEFVRAAADSAGDAAIEHVLADGANLPFADSSFDAVTAFMSLMDVAEPESTLREVARVLRPGGFVQFSVVHPLNGTPTRFWVEDDDGDRRALAIAEYFVEGNVHESWIFSAAPDEVQAQHPKFEITYARRTLAGWFDAVLGAGLTIEEVAEPHPDESTVAAHPEVADARIAPYFLLIRARLPRA